MFRMPAVTPALSTACPFCAGHERETPPEVARVGAGARDTPGWRVRVVPNKYPIVEGRHEVVILSPAHDADLARLAPDDATGAMIALRDRAASHLARGAVHAQPFINQGKAAGASIAHPHAQLVALDVVPSRVQERLDRFSPELFESDQTHVVTDGAAVVWCPVVPVSPFLMRCAIRSAGPRFDQATDDEIAVFVQSVQGALRRLDSLLGPVAYNVVIETAPRAPAAPFHWWADIVPRVTVPAGFELGTGVWVNIVPPADAAAALRDAQS
jgi:UDPglucose--hexose-1-phosphate uridylyltransferase